MMNRSSFYRFYLRSLRVARLVNKTFISMQRRNYSYACMHGREYLYFLSVSYLGPRSRLLPVSTLYFLLLCIYLPIYLRKVPT